MSNVTKQQDVVFRRVRRKVSIRSFFKAENSDQTKNRSRGLKSKALSRVESPKKVRDKRHEKFKTVERKYVPVGVTTPEDLEANYIIRQAPAPARSMIVEDQRYR